MHLSAKKLGALFFDTYCTNRGEIAILDIGSQDVNGSLNADLPEGIKYIVIDFIEGKNVDIVIKNPYQLPFDDSSVDAVVCSSVFEHSDFYWLLFLELVRVIKPG